MRDKRSDVDAFVNGERIAQNLLDMAMKAKNPAKSLDDVKRFFAAVGAGEFEPYTSEYVIREIEAYRNREHRDEMLKLITDYGVTVLPEDERVERLADLYVKAAVVPARYMDDALHIAFTTVHELDFIVSQNFEHIIKDKAIRLAAEVNEAEGYQGIGIYEPGEVMGDE